MRTAARGRSLATRIEYVVVLGFLVVEGVPFEGVLVGRTFFVLFFIFIFTVFCWYSLTQLKGVC